MRLAFIRKRPRATLIAGIAWPILIILIFLWQAVTYSGLVALTAEWQFREFGVYRPTLTFLAFAAVLIPLPFLFRRHKKGEEATSDLPQQLSAAIISSSRFMWLLIGGAFTCLAVSLFSLILILFLPGSSGPVQHLNANASSAVEAAEGLTEIRGKLLYNRMASIDHNVWFSQSRDYFAPMIEEGKDETTIRYLVELPAGSAAVTQGVEVRRGILRDNALPGELQRLYRYAGFHIAPNHYVLFSSARSMRWSYLVAALQWGLVSLLILLGACVQGIRRRKLIEKVRSINETDA